MKYSQDQKRDQLHPLSHIKKSKSHTAFFFFSSADTEDGARRLPSTKQFDEAGVAVGFVLLLLEASLAQRLQAEVTHEVVGVELGAHGGDAAAKDGLLAGLAQAPARLVVVGLAQWFALVFEEAAVDKGGVALLEEPYKGRHSERGKEREREGQTGQLASLATTVRLACTVIRRQSCEVTAFS